MKKIALIFVYVCAVLFVSCGDSKNSVLSIDDYEATVNEALQALANLDTVRQKELFVELELQTEIIEEVAKSDAIITGDTANLKKIWRLRDKYRSAFGK
jgi:hypothetical protein